MNDRKRLLLILVLILCYIAGLATRQTLAQDYMAKGRDLETRSLYGPAIAEYRRAIKETPENAAEAHYRIGVLTNKLGNTDGAAQEFRATLQLDPNHTEARQALVAFYVNRGVTARQQQKLANAIQELQEAITIDPNAATAHLELGQAYEDNGQLTEAVGEYQASVNADPSSITAQLHLGKGYNAQKQYAQAISAFQVVVEKNPDYAEAYEGLGIAYFHQGQKEEAQKAFNLAMRKHLIAGRRDLAVQVKQEADALLRTTSTP